jgi:aspartate racemase
MTLLAAFNVLLYRYTGQDDLIVGTPIANRHQTQFEGLIGPFINTLALRTQLAPDMSFRELLDRVKAVSLEAFSHQDLPFERLVEELHLKRSLSHSPLFQVMFSLQNTPSPSPELSGLAVSNLEINTGTAKFDLSLNMIDAPHGVQGIAEYSLDIFQPVTIERLIGHFQVLMEDIVVNPDTPIGQLSLLTEAMRHQLLVEWNASHSDFPKDVCVHELFEAQAAHRADAVAAVSEDQELTYRELNSRANKLAHHLLSLGVGPEKLVGICMERSLETIVGILGTLKAGGAFLPLDPKYPPERLAFMLEDAQASVLLTQQRLMGRLPQRVSQIICLDADWSLMANRSQENPASGAKPDNLVYVIYTSGSSGLPKGVEIEHTSLVNLITWHQTVFHVTATDRATQLAGPAFDASVWEIWPYLTAGATIYVPDENTLLSPTRIIQWLAANKITISFMPTPLAESVLAEVWPADLALRILLTGGDRLHHAPRSNLPFVLINNYGPTENTVVSTWTPVTESNHGSPPPIGRPIFNTQLYVLDPHRQPVPVGVPGELYVGGVGLARGYLNRAELTADRFIPNPFSDGPAARLYRTGDLVRYLPDGNLDFLGRLDNQVKLRGFRIELGEIEAVLGQHPGVREALVVDQEETPTQKRLAAYYVVQDQENSPTVEELRSFLHQKLPDYMLPSVFVELDLLPLTPNGKIDRRALPTPEKVHLGQAENLAPRDLLELQLTRIWGEVLGIENVGVKDNFFEIGGQSLSAVRLVSQIGKLTGNELPVSALFQGPTVEQLAHLLRRDGWSAPTSSLVAIQASGSKPPLFFVPGNLGNVFTDLGELARHLGPDQPFYGLQDSIENPIHVAALARHYVEAIRAVHPQGPYLLGGVCSGGLIAFEMGCQLYNDGQEVALLALVESYPYAPGLGTYIGSAAALVRRVLRGATQQVRQISQVSAAEQSTYLRLKAKVLGNLWGTIRYSPQSYPGCLELFFTREGLDSEYVPQAGWGKLASGGVTIHEIPGSHDRITGDNNAQIEAASMQVLAKQLQVCIQQALRLDP